MKQKLIQDFSKNLSVIETGTALLSNQLKKLNFDKFECRAYGPFRVLIKC